MASRLLHPALRPEIFEEIKRHRLESLAKAWPAHCAPLHAMRGASFDPALLRPSRGTVESVESLTAEDALAFTDRAVRPNLSALIFAGDVSMEEAAELAQRWFGLPRDPGEPPASPWPELPPASRRQKIYYRKGSSEVQTVIHLGLPDLPIGHPDEPALSFAASTLGGILNYTLRQEMGVTYGVRSRTHSFPVHYRTWSGGVENEALGRALRALLQKAGELDRYLWDPDRFERSRKGWIASLAGWYERASALANSNVTLFLDDRPLDHTARRIEEIQRVSFPEVQRAGRRYLRPELMQIVLVGDPATIEEQVGRLGYGELVRLADCADEGAEGSEEPDQG